MRIYTRKDPFERFCQYVKWEGTCMVWQAYLDGTGYGIFSESNGKKWKAVRAHRWIYEKLLGPIPGKLPLDHLCRRPNCVNINHLEPVTYSENLYRAAPYGTMGRMMRSRTHCKNGHEFTEENTRRYVQGRWNVRVCRECKRMHKLNRVKA